MCERFFEHDPEAQQAAAAAVHRLARHRSLQEGVREEPARRDEGRLEARDPDRRGQLRVEAGRDGVVVGVQVSAAAGQREPQRARRDVRDALDHRIAPVLPGDRHRGRLARPQGEQARLRVRHLREVRRRRRDRALDLLRPAALHEPGARAARQPAGALAGVPDRDQGDPALQPRDELDLARDRQLATSGTPPWPASARRAAAARSRPTAPPARSRPAASPSSRSRSRPPAPAPGQRDRKRCAHALMIAA